MLFLRLEAQLIDGFGGEESAAGGHARYLLYRRPLEYTHEHARRPALSHAARRRRDVRDREGAPWATRSVRPRTMPEAAVDEEHFASASRKGHRALLGPGRVHQVSRDGAPVGSRESPVVAAVEHLDAARFLRNVVESRPYLELRVAVEPPEVAAVLVPREIGSAPRPLGEQRGAVKGDRRTDDRARDAFEDGVLQPGEEEWVARQLLDLAIGVARPDPALPEVEVLVATGLRVVLEEEPNAPRVRCDDARSSARRRSATSVLSAAILPSLAQP